MTTIAIAIVRRALNIRGAIKKRNHESSMYKTDTTSKQGGRAIIFAISKFEER